MSYGPSRSLAYFGAALRRPVPDRTGPEGTSARERGLSVVGSPVAAKDHPRARAPAASRPAPTQGRRPTRRALGSLPETTSLWNAFYRIIRRIPIGRVCTYGA